MSTKVRSVSLIGLIAMLVLSLCLAFGAFVSVSAEENANTPHDVSECNKNLSDAQTNYSSAVTVGYGNAFTGRYGLQAYAGLAGEVWIIGDASGHLDIGTGSHPLGSNASDKRSNFVMTLSVDAETAGDAYLFLYMETYNQNEPLEMTVNNGTPTTVSLNGDSYGADWGTAYPVRPHAIPVTLVQGVNTIVLKTGENYTGWYHSFGIAPSADLVQAPNDAGSTFSYGISTWTALSEGFGSSDAIGLNAFDNAADYGKTGYAEYKIYAAEADTYRLGMYVMAGADLANRAKLTLNGNVLQFDGKDYYSFDISAGWSGDSWNYVDLALNAGVNTLRIENSLARVNEDKTQEVTEGGVLVSNWWMHSLTLTRPSSYSLVLNSDNVAKEYNIGWEPSAEEIAQDLVVYMSVNGEQQETPLAADDYEISVSNGTVSVSYTGSDYAGVQGASFSLSKTAEGLPHAGRTVTFNGTDSTGNLSWYNYAKIEGEGTGNLEGRLFYVMEGQPSVGGGYMFGSGGAGSSENRQMTLTLLINNTGAEGDYLLRSYVNANSYELNRAQIKVNDGEYADVNINGPASDGEKVYWPFVYSVHLKAGENTVTLKLCDQYSAWFNYFEISPIEYEDKAEYDVFDAAREGNGSIDTNAAEQNLIASTEARALTYFVKTAEDGKYEFSFRVGTVSGKTLKVSIDGAEAQTVTTSGTPTVSYIADLTAGNHTVKIIFEAGDASNIAFSGMTKTLCRPVDEVTLDTSEMDLTIEQGSNLNLANLKVSVKYTGEEDFTVIESGYTVDTSAVQTDTPGTYKVRVSMAAYPDKYAEFEVTVTAKRAVSGIKVDASAVENLANGASLDYSKLVVTLVYNDGSEIRAMSSDYIVTAPEGFDSKVAGTYTFTVTYSQDDGITATFDVTVAEGESEGGCSSAVGVSAAAGAAGVLVLAGAFALLRKRRQNRA